MKTQRLLTMLLLAGLICSTCKKKTSITARAFNYALNEPIANANIVLVERKLSSGLGGGGGYSCKEIASATTDNNGECHFDKEKLRSSSSYQYYMAITNAYDTDQSYPCSGKTSGFLNKGKTTEVVLDASGFDGYIIVQENNLLNPSQQGDSIDVRIISGYYSLPNEQYPNGGGGVFVDYAYYGCNGFPFPSILTSNPIKTQCGKKAVKVHKRKMGIVTTRVDTVRVYPNQTTTVIIDW